MNEYLKTLKELIEKLTIERSAAHEEVTRIKALDLPLNQHRDKVHNSFYVRKHADCAIRQLETARNDIRALLLYDSEVKP
nr:hypothetical protein [Candidatus Sigynarchaeota archaeon]